MIFVTTGVVNEFRQATRGEKGVSPTFNFLKVFQWHPPSQMILPFKYCLLNSWVSRILIMIVIMYNPCEFSKKVIAVGQETQTRPGADFINFLAPNTYLSRPTPNFWEAYENRPQI